MLAFRACEKDEHGSYTDEAELGAELELRRLNALINIEEMLSAYFEALAKASKKINA